MSTLSNAVPTNSTSIRDTFTNTNNWYNHEDLPHLRAIFAKLEELLSLHVHHRSRMVRTFVARIVRMAVVNDTPEQFCDVCKLTICRDQVGEKESDLLAVDSVRLVQVDWDPAEGMPVKVHEVTRFVDADRDPPSVGEQNASVSNVLFLYQFSHPRPTLQCLPRYPRRSESDDPHKRDTTAMNINRFDIQLFNAPSMVFTDGSSIANEERDFELGSDEETDEEYSTSDDDDDIAGNFLACCMQKKSEQDQRMQEVCCSDEEEEHVEDNHELLIVGDDAELCVPPLSYVETLSLGQLGGATRKDSTTSPQPSGTPSFGSTPGSTSTAQPIWLPLRQLEKLTIGLFGNDDHDQQPMTPHTSFASTASSLGGSTDTDSARFPSNKAGTRFRVSSDGMTPEAHSTDEIATP